MPSELLQENLNLTPNRTIAALSYIWVLCLIPLLMKRDDAEVQFHAKQGLILFLIEAVSFGVFWVPLFGQLLFFGLVFLSVVGIFYALTGQQKPLPVIGRFIDHVSL